MLSLSRTTVILHWLVAAALIGMIGLGLYMANLPRGPEKVWLIQVHKSCGVIVLFLLLTRLAWRLREGWPSSGVNLVVWEGRLSRGVHWFMLLAPFAMVASGIAASITYARGISIFGLPFIPKLLNEKNVEANELAGAIHAIVAYCIMAAILLHIAGALRHHFVLKDSTLARMLGGRRADREKAT